MKTAENDNTEAPIVEEEWKSALMMVSLPLAIIATAVGCHFFL
jgi:hypothetical protein